MKPKPETHLQLQSSEMETAVFDGRNLKLRKLILDKFDIQVKVVIVEGKFMVRVCAQVYNTMSDYKRLADAVLELAVPKRQLSP